MKKALSPERSSGAWASSNLRKEGRSSWMRSVNFLQKLKLPSCACFKNGNLIVSAAISPFELRCGSLPPLIVTWRLLSLPAPFEETYSIGSTCFQLRFLLSAKEKRPSPCSSNTSSIVTQGRPERGCAASTRRPSNCFSRIPGLETFANFRTSSNVPSLSVKRKFSQSIKAGSQSDLLKLKRDAGLSPRDLRLKRRPRLRRLWRKPEEGSRDLRARQPYSASRLLRCRP